MKKFVVDASVVVKWFVPEVHSIEAARLLDPEIVILVPDLVAPEFGNTLWKKVRRRELTREEADEIIAAFDMLALEIYPSKPLLSSAFRIAAAVDRTVYDSLYIALAVAQDCVLITDDRKFHGVIAESPLAEHIRWIGQIP
jgi:predicted nucleic acid-binding protein